MNTDPATESFRGDPGSTRTPDAAPSRLSVMLRAWTLGALAISGGMRWWLYARRRHRRADDGRGGAALATMCERMGPTFIKIAQLLGSRPDLIGVPAARALARVRDHVTPFPSAEAIRIVERSLGAPLSRCFARFDPVPVAAGSIAQVHVALLESGERAAVKVRRPGLGKVMVRDFAVLRGMAWLLERTPWFRNVPLKEVVAEIEGTVMGQLDFRRERSNNERFRRNLAGRPQIVIPRTLPELCTEDLIVMEYIGGLTPVDMIELPQLYREAASVRGMEALCSMIFVHGFIHADLHPGNVFVQEDGTIVMFDFGLVAELDDRERRRFGEFFLAMSTNNGETCAAIVLETASTLPASLDRAAFILAMKDLVARFSGRSAGEFEVTGFVTALFALQHRFGVRGSTAFMMTIISLLLFEGILKSLNPSFDFQGSAALFLLGLSARMGTANGSGSGPDGMGSLPEGEPCLRPDNS